MPRTYRSGCARMSSPKPTSASCSSRSPRKSKPGCTSSHKSSNSEGRRGKGEGQEQREGFSFPSFPFPLPLQAMINASIKQLSAALAARTISSVELTQLYLDRIAILNPKLNTYITLNPETSLEQARAADARLAAGNADTLTGIPIAQKDIF